MTYAIQDNIPVPEVVQVGRPGTDYPFADMQPTQCFMVPVPAPDAETTADAMTKRILNRMRTAAQRYKKLNAADSKYRIATHVDQFTGDTVVGVWRLS